jgi:DNA polymerase III subunit delta
MPLFAFLGNDELRKQEALEAAVVRFESEGECVRETHFGEELQWQHIAESYNTADLFAPRKALIIKHFDKVHAAGQKELEAAFSHENAQVGVFFSAEKLDGRGSFAKRLKEAGAVQEFKLPYENQIPQWLAQRARERYQRSLGPTEAKLLQERVGGDLAELDHELEKLDTFLPKGAPITAKEIEDISSPVRVSLIWELQRLMGMRQKTAALLTLRNLLDHGEQGFLITMQLFRHYVRLLRIRLMLDKGASENEIVSTLGLNQFIHVVKERQIDQARTRPAERWKMLLARLARLEWEMKQGRYPHRFEVELALAAMV